MKLAMWVIAAGMSMFFAVQVQQVLSNVVTLSATMTVNKLNGRM